MSNDRLTAKLVGVLAGIVIFGAARRADAITYELRADASSVVLPGAAAPVPIWGFADDTGLPGGTAAVTLPGPTLEVPAGDTLTIHLTNALPVPISIVVPGQAIAPPPLPIEQDGRVRSFVKETAPGATETYTFPAMRSGTFLLQSATNPAVQVQMGLYGAVVVGDAPPGTIDELLVFSEIDPVLHHAVAADPFAPHSAGDYQPKWFLVNGQAHPSTPAVELIAGVPTHLRLLNAGFVDYAPTMPGLPLTLLREDGYDVPFRRAALALNLVAGKALEAEVLAPAPGSFVLYDRRLHVSNAGAGPGGMIVLFDAVSPTSIPNTPPVVDAGPDQSASVGTVALVGAAADDDGPATLATEWHQLSGPAAVAFADPAAASTTASFTAVGTYVLALAASDGLATVTDTVTITIELEAAPAAASGVMVTRSSRRNLSLTWQDEASNETGFVVERRESFSGVPTAWTVVATPPANAEAFVDANAPRGTQTHLWQYRVSAVNAGGASAPTESPWVR